MVSPKLVISERLLDLDKVLQKKKVFSTVAGVKNIFGTNTVV